MALVNSDDETTKRNQVLGPQKSKALSILGPGLITGASMTIRAASPRTRRSAPNSASAFLGRCYLAIR